ncbi:MAG: response regulator [Rubrivivax sp.]|nr:response regulator [Rubrivivax sp.]
MIAPRTVPGRAVRRLRRRYAWLMLALAAPVLAAAVYVLRLQYEIVRAGALRQLATSADRRVTQLDAALGRMREDLLRVGVSVQTAGYLARAVDVDKRSLAPDTAGTHTLDALPQLLRNVAPQVILAGPAWTDGDRRDSAVERAALFAEHVQLMMLRGGRFGRVTHIDVDTEEVWIYPWMPSAQWYGELSAANAPEAIRRAAGQVDASGERGVPVEGELSWRVRTAADGQRVLTLAMVVPGSADRRLVFADAPLAALEAGPGDAGGGRFWVVDGAGELVLDHVTHDVRAGAVLGVAPPPPGRVAAALAAPVAREVGALLVAARRSSIAPWTAFHATDAAGVRRGVLLELWPYLAGGALLLVLFLAVSTYIWRHFGQPSLRLVDYLNRLSSDETAALPKVPRDWAPWLQLTRDTYAAWRDAAARERKSEALKSAIVDHALAAVVSTDAQGLIVEFNPAAERMFSYSRAEMIGRPAGGTIVAAAVLDAYVEDLRRLRRGEPPQLIGRRVELPAHRRDGTGFPVDAVLWRTQVGDETFVTASLYDLSERRAAQEEIARQREALRQAEKLAAMGSLLAGVAHELNNPLAIVMGRASLLEDKCTDPALRADAVRIREAAERCGRIVRSFLAMARSRPAVRAAVQLNDLVRGAVDLLQYSLRTSGVVLEQQLQRDLPLVVADADPLGQVLMNLIVNAQQAVAQVEPPRHVRVETGHDAGTVWLRVADNGAGIAPADRERIFEAFVTTKAEGVGTGLGLAVSRSVAVGHGGSLRLEDHSPFGRGASFRLELPLQPAPAQAPVAPAAPPLVPPAATASAPRVLVVDDEPELASMMRAALEAAGHKVVTAESGAVALALLGEGRFDVVVTDLRMPGIDGGALWRVVREHDAALARRFVFVTGDTLSPLPVELRRDGGAEVLEKPFAASDLVERVRRCVAGAGPA